MQINLRMKKTKFKQRLKPSFDELLTENKPQTCVRAASFKIGDLFF